MADVLLAPDGPAAVSGLSVILDQAATAVALTAALAALLTAAATGPWSRAAKAFQAPLTRLWPARLILGLFATAFLAVQPLRLPLVARSLPPGSWLARGGLCRLHLFGVTALTWPLMLALAGALLSSPLPRGWALQGVKTRMAAAKAAKAAAVAAAPTSPAASSAPASPAPAEAPQPPKRRWSLRRVTAVEPQKAGPPPPPPPQQQHQPAALTLSLPTRRTAWAALGWAALSSIPLAAMGAALAWLPLNEQDDGYGGAGVGPAARGAFAVCERPPRAGGLRVDGDTDAAGLLPDGAVDPNAPCGCLYPGALLTLLALTTALGCAWVALAARSLARSALNRRLAGRLATVSVAVPVFTSLYTVAAMATRLTPPSEGWPASAASLVLALTAVAAAASLVLPLVVAPAAAARGARLDAEARLAARAARVAAVARAAAAAPGESAVTLLAGDVNENAEADAAAAKDAEDAIKAEKEAAADADAALAAVEAALAADAVADAAEAKRARHAAGWRWWHALVPGARRRADEAQAAAEAEEEEDAATIVTSVVGGGGRTPGVGVVGAPPPKADAWATESDEE